MESCCTFYYCASCSIAVRGRFGDEESLSQNDSVSVHTPDALRRNRTLKAELAEALERHRTERRGQREQREQWYTEDIEDVEDLEDIEDG